MLAQVRVERRQLDLTKPLLWSLLAMLVVFQGAWTSALASEAPVHDCDHLVAVPMDPERVAPAVPFRKVDADKAIQACEQAVATYPGVYRFKFQLGRALYRGEREEEAIAQFEAAAAHGYVAAQRDLGLIYLARSRSSGQDPANEQHAQTWLDQAAAQGDSQARLSLGKLLLAHNDKAQQEEGLEWVRLSAKSGLAEAQDYLGTLFYHGRYLEEDRRQAVAWWRLAADQNEPNALRRLGTAFVMGRGGLPESTSEGIALLRRAGALGNRNAQLLLGMMYHEGWWVTENLVQARHWYRCAARQAVSRETLPCQVPKVRPGR